MSKAHGLSKPYTSSDKSFPRRQAAAEEGLSTPTLQYSFPKLPTLWEAELLIKHHLPGSVEADWGWPRAKEKLPKYTGKNAPPFCRPQFPPPGSSWSCFYFIRLGNPKSRCTSEHQKTHIRGSGYLQSHPLQEKARVLFPAPNTLARTHTHTQSFPEKSGVWMCV